MRTAVATIKGISPLSWGKRVTVERLEDENDAGYEKRNWREKFHCTDDGLLLIPAMAFKGCLESAAKYKSEKIPGKGQQKYTKYFESGVIVPENLGLPQTKDDLVPNWLFVPSNGVPGHGKRVDKCFPVLNDWGGDVTFLILENAIPKDVFEKTLSDAGQVKGIGFWRPEHRGINGRFLVKKIKWGKM